MCNLLEGIRGRFCFVPMLDSKEASETMPRREVQEGSWREAAANFDKNFHIGAAIQPDFLKEHFEPYGTILDREFNSIVLENHHKWKHMLVGGDEGVYDFTPSDTAVDWARERDMIVKGHTLCYHISAPSFLEDLSASRLRETLYRHIRTTVGHFYGRVDYWDVVNEALSVDNSGRMENNVFFRKLGPSYVDDCFRVAHQADPNAKLIYNDNKIEGAGLPNGRSAKSDGMYDMVKGMKERGIPIHGVGMQCHFTAAGTKYKRAPTPHSINRNVRRLGKLGLSVNISEIDVRIADLPEDVDGAKAQIDIYADTLAACLSEPNFDGMTLWGLTDRFSWVHDFYKPDTPLPWDRDYEPKPLVGAIRDTILRHAPKSRRWRLHRAKVLSMPEEEWGKDWMFPAEEDED